MAVVGVASAVGSDATACSCPPSQCGDVATADAIFVATVERSIPLYRMNSQGVGDRLIGRTAYLNDIRQLRGQAETTIRTGLGNGDCGYEFRPGVRYFIAARRDANGRLETSICSLTRPVSEAAGLIAYVASLNRPPDGARVWGHVELARSDRSGRSTLRDTSVTIRGPIEETTTIDTDGNYGFTKLPVGRYTVSAAPPTERKGLITIPDLDVTVDLTHLTAVPEGRYRVGLNFLGGPDRQLPYPISAAKTASGSDEVSVGAGEHGALSPLLLTPLDPLTLDVRIQFADGSPVDDVRVEAFAARAAAPVLAAEATTPIAPGRFRLALYRETSYQVRVRRALRTLHTVEVSANETLVVITLPRR